MAVCAWWVTLDVPGVQPPLNTSNTCLHQALMDPPPTFITKGRILTPYDSWEV